VSAVLTKSLVEEAMKSRMIVAALLMAGMSMPVMAQQVDPNAGIPTGRVQSAAGAMVPANPSVPENPSAPVGSAANPVVMGGNVTPPPPGPRDVPICSKTVTDSCMNPSQAHGARQWHKADKRHKAHNGRHHHHHKVQKANP
jgi:hypothetical protein